MFVWIYGFFVKNRCVYLLVWSSKLYVFMLFGIYWEIGRKLWYCFDLEGIYFWWLCSFVFNCGGCICFYFNCVMLFFCWCNNIYFVCEFWGRLIWFFEIKFLKFCLICMLCLFICCYLIFWNGFIYSIGFYFLLKEKKVDIYVL